MGDPFLVEEVGLLALRSAVDKEQKQGQDFHALLLETFSNLLELLTLRHRLIEMNVESAHLARLYKELAQEMGFEEFHLYMRPVPFEFVSHKDKVDLPPPVFMTSLLEDSSQVDRYSPTALVLAITELGDNQIGKFSFYTKDAILKLLFHSGVENMQMSLACQATQKNALMAAIQQAAFYDIPGTDSPGDAKAFSMFPWRAFLEDGGPFPVMSSIPNTLEYDMQMCLCGLSDRDRKVAHVELVGVQALMEDVLLSGSHVITDHSPERQATQYNTQLDWSKRLGLCPSQLESHAKASALLEGPCEAVMPFALLKCFLVLWKQLEVLKEHWGRLKLQGQEINSAPLHKQFSELYEADIFYPSMKALARRVGKEDEFEELIIRSQSILPPMGASEIEIKAQQVHRALQFAFEKLPCCTGTGT
ncbi:Transmembrane protein FLJ37396 [Cricetulus griseus]|uniref:Transmembrane protein FLJ37396 n=1 Tax=Cricetulus griseus TaxID=10029 RepID=G3GXL3_CRIGR|nr:Transmembrane protein FLJ37396 [Cricetulus griseus]